MEKPKEELMNMAEYEAFIAVVNAFTNEQKQVALRLLPDDLIWAEISNRYYEQKNKLDNILNAARA
jgi:hypothetical protein